MATSFEVMAAWMTTAWTPSMPMATNFEGDGSVDDRLVPRPLNRWQRPAPHTAGRKTERWPGPPSLFYGIVMPATRAGRSHLRTRR